MEEFMPVSRRTMLVAGFALSATSVSGQTAGGSKAKFTQSAFDAAQAAGKPILIEVSAPWCPTCKVQGPIISSLVAKPEFGKIAVFEVDFDSQKDVLAKFNVRQQSTLIAFKGRSEVSRSTGETKAESIARLLKTAI
jgi:thioredoxin 1